MAKKKPPLNIIDEDICADPDIALVESLLGDALPGPSYSVRVDRDFMSDIIQEAEEGAMRQMGKSGIIPPTPAELKSTAQSIMKIHAKPSVSLSSAMANPTENDNLLSVIRDNKPVNTVLKAVMEEIAEEVAYLKAWRNENWSTGEDLSEATFKRIKMLKHLVETIIEQEKLKKDSTTGKVDFHGEPFQRVLKYFLETIQKTFRKVHIPEQFEDIFFTELAKAFDNFEKNAERIYYGKD